MRGLMLAALVLWVPVTVRGQGTARDTLAARDQLPRDVAQEVVALYNATTGLRATEPTEIAAGRDVAGDVAVLDGPLTIGGHVAGRVLAINSDVILLRGARIDGDLLVVGGEVEGSDGASIGGELRIYHPPLQYTRDGDLLVAQLDETRPVEQWWRRFERRRRRNFNRLEIASAGPYNRVEGLPVRIGPVLYRDQGWGHVRLDATAVLRSASSFSSSKADVGHDVNLEARLGRRLGASVGGRLFDVVDGVEQWQLSNVEVALASFLFHRDYRDYYGRHGAQVYAALHPTETVELSLAFGDERWRSRPTRDPFSLAMNGMPWRDNPTMDAGRFHVANLTLRLDTRNDRLDPRDGWYVLGDLERGTGRIDASGATSAGVRIVPEGDTRYLRGFVDARRYNRIAPNAQLNLRLVLGGWLAGDPLPLERRLSIDGPGTVPGFDFRSGGGMDVGTCSEGAAPAGRPAQCERVGLAQLEYRNDIHVSVTRGSGEARRTRFRLDGAWVFFADAGRGWLVNSPASPLDEGKGKLPSLSSYRTDIGAGLDFDLLGLYVAKALSSPNEPANVFLRVRHRF
ncbi:MAG TPA: BamA/TamA family outer membrane protein [Gemmatimonadaceae bacterium]|nr:BamA/TamA family outer membrane protein [Gemmatimonadaceae bacterium]